MAEYVKAGIKKNMKARGGKKAAAHAATPIFLRKTYEMIDICDQNDPSIACWSDEGTSFVVKDKKRFETEVIPQYFNHNKLSSFVRQLNMYGFRKVKNESILIKDAEDSVESNYCKFAHPKFLKDRKDLVAQISKSSHNESADKEVVEGLRAEIKSLKKSLASAKGDIAELKALVGTLLTNQGVQAQNIYLPEVTSKKRKIEEQTPMPVISKQSPALMPLPSVTSADNSLENLEDNFVAGPVCGVPTVQPLTERGESISAESFASLDHEIMESLIDLDAVDDISVLDNVAIPDGVFSNEQTDASKPVPSTVDPELVEKLNNALSNLPPEMQRMLVDRIVLAIANPEVVNQQVDAMTSLALAAAEEAQRRLVVAGRDPNDKHCIPLASAVLGAYLAHYSAAGAQTAVSNVPLQYPSSCSLAENRNCLESSQITV